MRPDRERDGVVPVDIWQPYTPQERRDIEHATDPRRDWPSGQEAEEDMREPEIIVDENVPYNMSGAMFMRKEGWEP